MGAERSTEATRIQAAPAVKERAIECGDLAGLYARGLEARGYAASADGGKVTTTAPESVYAEMDASYRASRAAKAKK